MTVTWGTIPRRDINYGQTFPSIQISWSHTDQHLAIETRRIMETLADVNFYDKQCGEFGLDSSYAAIFTTLEGQNGFNGI
jgi:hypothetical protein